MNKTWHPIGLVTALIVLFYVGFVTRLSSYKTLLVILGLGLVIGSFYLFTQIILNLLKQKFKWAFLQGIGLVINGILLVPAGILALNVLPIIVTQERLNPQVELSRIESQVRSSCADEIKNKCSAESQDFEAISVCLGSLGYRGVNTNCSQLLNLEMKFPPLQQFRDFGKIHMPVGTQITRQRGRIIYVDAPDGLRFGKAKCRGGVIHWSYIDNNPEGKISDSDSYVMDCFLDGDQEIEGIKFKDGDKPAFPLLNSGRATFFYPSGRVKQGVLSESQNIGGKTIEPSKSGWIHFGENGEVTGVDQ